MTVWKQVGQNLAGLAKHALKTVVNEPMEVAKEAVGGSNSDATGQKLEQGVQTQQNTSDPAQGKAGDDLAQAGFKNQDDFAKYQQLSGNKDLMELSIIRKRLQSEWGLDTTLEGGMQKARQEWQQKEEERKREQDKKEEEKKQMVAMQKKEEDEAMAVKAAREAASAENKAWGAG